MKTVINNGLLVDPKNRIFSKLNVAIEKGKVVEISRDKLQGDREIDARGLIVSPGFIDIHIHEDSYNSEKDDFDISIFECMVKMGVTTAIGGNCGDGEISPKLYLDAVDRKGVPINIGLLVGHSLLRRQTGATDKYKKITTKQLTAMKELADQYLLEGCFGISFGIRYIPGITKDELVEVSRVASKYKKIVAAHIRDDADKVIEAAQEFIGAGVEVGASIQVSHIGSMGAYGQMEQLLSLIDYYKTHGIDIYADCYPYNAFSTSIGQTTYDEGFLQRYNTSYSSIEIAEGKYRGQRCTEEIFRELRENYPSTITIGHVMQQQEVEEAIVHPNVIIASDGFMHNYQGHPRASGTFPRFIKRYSGEGGRLSIFEAIEKITYLPAKRLGLCNKGTIEVGSDADIVIFDINTLEDKATFDNPSIAPEGIRYVLVNGEVAVRDKEVINWRLGKSVRKS